MSKKAIHWSGVFPAVSTQFRSDYSLDLDATHAVMKNLVKDGVSGLVVCGSVGENTSLSTDEKLQIIEVAKDAAAAKFRLSPGWPSSPPPLPRKWRKRRSASASTGSW